MFVDGGPFQDVLKRVNAKEEAEHSSRRLVAVILDDPDTQDVARLAACVAVGTPDDVREHIRRAALAALDTPERWADHPTGVRLTDVRRPVTTTSSA
jgi:hypothetical protein